MSDATGNTKGSVRIGPEFFRKIAADYRDYKFAWPREILQNSMDAPGSDSIDIKIETVNGRSVATVRNNGQPMSRETLCDKFLALGGSGKNCENGAVGGFGVAKSLLCFMNKHYAIRTGNLLVDGCGADYTITELPELLHGTETTVEFFDDITTSLVDNTKRCVTLSQWRGSITLNGEEIAQRLNKGRGRKDLDFGRVYTNDNHSELLVVRIQGIVMFTRWISYKGTVVLELNGKSNEVLQSNRDSLKYTYADQLDNFVVELSVNKRSALRDNTPTIEKKRYTGYKLKGKSRSSQIAQIAAKAILRERDGGERSPGMGEAAPGPYDTEDVPVLTAALATIQVQMSKSSGVLSNPTTREVVRPAVLKPDFFMKNETGLKIPAWFTPEAFSDYSKALIWRWMQCLIVLADTFECVKPFSVGFVFTEEAEAQHEKEGQDHVLYINPAQINRHDGKPAAIEKRWKFDQDGIWYLVSVAAHEFVHLEGFSAHDENYSTRYTEVMGRVLAERTKFAKIFQAKVEWPEDN